MQISKLIKCFFLKKMWLELENGGNALPLQPLILRVICTRFQDFLHFNIAKYDFFCLLTVALPLCSILFIPSDIVQHCSNMFDITVDIV